MFLKLNNVFITHAQLEKIINSRLVERNVLKNNERKAHLITSAQRGVSKEKQNAKDKEIVREAPILEDKEIEKNTKSILFDDFILDKLFAICKTSV